MLQRLRLGQGRAGVVAENPAFDIADAQNTYAEVDRGGGYLDMGSCDEDGESGGTIFASHADSSVKGKKKKKKKPRPKKHGAESFSSPHRVARPVTAWLPEDDPVPTNYVEPVFDGTAAYDEPATAEFAQGSTQVDYAAPFADYTAPVAAAERAGNEPIGPQYVAPADAQAGAVPQQQYMVPSETNGTQPYMMQLESGASQQQYAVPLGIAATEEQYAVPPTAGDAEGAYDVTLKAPGDAGEHDAADDAYDVPLAGHEGASNYSSLDNDGRASMTFIGTDEPAVSNYSSLGSADGLVTGEYMGLAPRPGAGAASDGGGEYMGLGDRAGAAIGGGSEYMGLGDRGRPAAALPAATQYSALARESTPLEYADVDDGGGDAYPAVAAPQAGPGTQYYARAPQGARHPAALYPAVDVGDAPVSAVVLGAASGAVIPSSKVATEVTYGRPAAKWNEPVAAAAYPAAPAAGSEQSSRGYYQQPPSAPPGAGTLYTVPHEAQAYEEPAPAELLYAAPVPVGDAYEAVPPASAAEEYYMTSGNPDGRPGLYPPTEIGPPAAQKPTILQSRPPTVGSPASEVVECEEHV